MKKKFSLQLDKIYCFKESDGHGHSEPYMWPIILVINDISLVSATPVKCIFKGTNSCQIVLKNDMEAFDEADIPQQIGLFNTIYPDQLNRDYIIVAVLLWEKDSTPKKCVVAGYSTFRTSIQSAITNNLAELDSSGDLNEIKNNIITQVKAEIRSAIENKLSLTEKINVETGVLNLDDYVGVDFHVFKNLQVTPGLHTFLAFQSEDDKNLYVMHGLVRVALI